MNTYIKYLLTLFLLTFSCQMAVGEEDQPVKDQKTKEALEIRAAEEKEIKAQFNYTFNEVSDYIVTVSCESRRGRSSGSAFVAKMDGKVYLFTNQHVILGADKISFKTASGKTLRPQGVQLSATRDIARLPLPEADGIAISETMRINAPITVFGNSEGGGVATELYGKVTGVSAETVEVSAEFVSGNSGSPVLNLDREVIGIASYVSWKNSDDDGSETRRYCYRLTGINWQNVKWKKYNEKYGNLYRDNEVLIDSIYDIANFWYKAPYNRMNADDHRDSDLSKWSTAHNRMINRIARQSEKGRATQHELDNINKQISKDMQDSAEDLAAVCLKRARQMKFLADQKELTGFLNDAFVKLAERMEYAAADIERYGSLLAEKDYFHFK